MNLSREVPNHRNSILALFPGPTHPGSQRVIPKRAGTPSSQPLFIAFLPSRSQMSKPVQNPRPIFLETRAIFFGRKGSKNLTPFSTHLKLPSPGTSISRSAGPYYIECRVIRQCFIIKSSLPWKDSSLSYPNPKIWVAAFLILPQEGWIVCRQDICCVCSQDICCVSSPGWPAGSWLAGQLAPGCLAAG